jgi:hypothetical protein
MRTGHQVRCNYLFIHYCLLTPSCQSLPCYNRLACLVLLVCFDSRCWEWCLPGLPDAVLCIILPPLTRVFSGHGPQSPAGGTKAAAEVLRMHLFETRERLRRAVSAARSSLSPSPTPYHGSGAARTSRFGQGAAASPVGTAGMLVVATEGGGTVSQNGALLTPGWSPTFAAAAARQAEPSSPVFSLTAQGLVPAPSPVARGRSGRSAGLGFVSAPGSRRTSLSDTPPSPVNQVRDEALLR